MTGASESFESHADAVLERLRAGASIEDAAREEGVAPRTISRWLRRGREDPGGPYGDFAAAYDTAHTAGPPGGRMTADEVLELLENAARSGSVTAQKALLERFDRRRGAEPAPTGGILDELEQRRARR